MTGTVPSDIDAIRRHGILSSLAGFPFLLVFGIVWITAGILSDVVPRDLRALQVLAEHPGNTLVLGLQPGTTPIPMRDRTDVELPPPGAPPGHE